MSKKLQNIFIGVAWPYVNGDIHIGHLAGYLLPADVCARFHRMRGHQVLMVSGSDCYGTPITVEADKRGISARDLIDEYHPKTEALFKELGISFDLYTRTTTENHNSLTQEIFLTLLSKELIFKDITKQYYSSQENRFLPDRYVEGTCPICQAAGARSDQCDSCGSPISEGELINPKSRNTGSAVELKNTEHYFLDWPKLQPFLAEYVAKASPSWRPWIRNETNKWLKEGLRPRAITRDLDWGVEIPIDRIPANQKIDNHQSKRIYVWFDAVIGYLSASMEWASQRSDREWQSFWKQESAARHFYFMGKDNLVFHTLFWPGQLHAYDPTLELPEVLAINQFLTLEGQKFSKSKGVTIDSSEIVRKYGLDNVRFYICSIAPEHADSNFTWDEFITKTNSILVANIGNFVNRVLKLGATVDFASSYTVDKETLSEVIAALVKADAAIRRADLREYIDITIALASFGNKYITVKAPWAIKDRASPEFASSIASCLSVIIGVATLLSPVVPGSMAKLAQMLSIPQFNWLENEDQIRSVLSQCKINNPEPLFMRIEKPLSI